MFKIALTEDFLKSTFQQTLDYWSNNKILNEWSCDKTIKGVGCLKIAYKLKETRKGNLSFELYNFLGVFSGHYQILINPNTFEYKIRKFADYCTLNSYVPTKDTSVLSCEDLTDEQRIEMNGHIAYTLYSLFYSCYRRDYPIASVSYQQSVYKKVAEDF